MREAEGSARNDGRLSQTGILKFTSNRPSANEISTPNRSSDIPVNEPRLQVSSCALDKMQSGVETLPRFEEAGKIDI